MPADRHDSSEGVGFLTAFLLRHPQVGSARLYNEQLRLDFYLRRRIGKKELESFREHLRLSWQVFFQLQRLQPGHLDMLVGQSPPAGYPFLQDSDHDEQPEVESLSIIRDLSSLTVEELSLLVELVREQFDDGLAYEDNGPGEDAEGQEEILHRSLERLRTANSDAPLTGFRDDLRVLIYPSGQEAMDG